MLNGKIKFYIIFLVCLLITRNGLGQNGVPAGINYQAVARDSYGKELVNSNIDVRFSIVSQNPLGPIVYQELHSKVVTSKYGVFSLIIGKGIATGGIYPDISRVQWADSQHFLKVELKLDNNFIDMGTMQFLSVPYALFASRSLEPGPAGPKGDTGSQGIPGTKGDPGDPASDKQSLSVINVEGSDYLAISGGNQVKISNIERDGDPLNEIQDLSINNDKLKITNNANAQVWDLSPYRQSLTYDPATRTIGITGSSTPVNLNELKNDDDANPTNEIQSLSLATDVLSISGSNNVNLSAYKDNTDNQTLDYSESSGTKSLQISGGNSVTIGNMVAFRAEKTIADGPLGDGVILIFENIKYNNGSSYNNATGEFIAPAEGIYNFNVRYDADLGSNINVYLNNQLFEKLAESISGLGAVHRSFTMKLSIGDAVKIVVKTGVALKTGTGSFSGFRVY